MAWLNPPHSEDLVPPNTGETILCKVEGNQIMGTSQAAKIGHKPCGLCNLWEVDSACFSGICLLFLL